MDQQQFEQKREELLGVARRNHNELTMEQLIEAFGEIAEDETHREILRAYFTSKHVIVYTGDEKADQEQAARAVEQEFSYTPEDKAYIEEYQSQLEALPGASAEQLQEWIAAAVDGDVAAQGELLQAYLPKASDLARTFAGQGIFLEDLIGEANLALAEAIPQLESYVELGADPAANETLVEGFLGSRMIEALELMVREEISVKQEDQSMADRINEVADAANELSRELGHKVSISELVQNTELSEEQVRDVIRLLGNGRSDLSLEIEEEE
ncbi:MAG: hypothetical protein K6E18_09930 [Lachnospiraceae bacterium]|nr:hypothetical protein [Lachnospiraceae bacterium]